MFYNLIIATLLTVSINALAKDLTAQDLKDRIQINADIYEMDVTGIKVLAGPIRSSFWRINPEPGTLESNWSSSFQEGTIAIRHNWKVENDGSIKVSIEQFSQVSDGKGDKEFTGSAGKKEFVVKNFEPITWKVSNIKGKNFIVRFFPTLRPIFKPMEVDNLPVSGTKVVVTDNNGYLWTDDVEFNGKYVGITTHRGTLILSYAPFLDAKELGTAELNQITIDVDKKYQISLRAETAFLPAGMTAKVYAMYLPEKKSKGLHSVGSFDSNKIDRIKEAIDKK